jgi:hypothetical protein
MTGSHQPRRLTRDFLGTFGPYTHDQKSCTELAASCISRRVWLITRPLGHSRAHCSRFGLHNMLPCNFGWDASGIGVLVTSLLFLPINTGDLNHPTCAVTIMMHNGYTKEPRQSIYTLYSTNSQDTISNSRVCPYSSSVTCGASAKPT